MYVIHNKCGAPFVPVKRWWWRKMQQQKKRCKETGKMREKRKKRRNKKEAKKKPLLNGKLYAFIGNCVDVFVYFEFLFAFFALSFSS